MRHVRRGVPAALLAVAVAAGASGCSFSVRVSHSSPAPAQSAGPLAGLTADQIVTKANADLFAASSLRMRGTRTGAGSGTFDLELAPGRGCTGTIEVTGSGDFQIVVIGRKLWLRPNAAYWKQQHSSPAVLRLVSGKYLSGTTADSGLGVLSSLCVLSHTGRPAAGGSGTSLTFDGQPAIAFGAPGDQGIVSDSATPEVLQMSVSSSSTLDFSDYNVPVRLTAPPADETIDGAGYGM